MLYLVAFEDKREKVEQLAIVEAESTGSAHRKAGDLLTDGERRKLEPRSMQIPENVPIHKRHLRIVGRSEVRLLWNESGEENRRALLQFLYPKNEETEKARAAGF